jgi:hypothetical protein
MVWPRSDSSERETGENVGGSVGHGRSSYKSVRELVEKSDLIGVGTVAKSYIGKVYADDPTGQYPTRDLHTIVNLEEILKGSANSDQVTIVTLELAFAGPNQPDWRQPGERVLLFLTSSKETPDFFTLSNYFQTAYLIVGDDVRRAIAGDTSGVAGSIAGMSLSEVRQTARDSR